MSASISGNPPLPLQSVRHYFKGSDIVRSRIIERDLALAETTMNAWRLHMRQQTRKPFRLDRDVLSVGQVLLYADTYVSSMQVVGQTLPDQLTVAIPLNAVPGTLAFGKPIRMGVALAGINQCIDLQLVAGQQLLVAVLDCQHVAQLIGEKNLNRLQECIAGRFVPLGGQGRNLLHLLGGLLKQSQRPARMENGALFRQQLEQVIIAWVTDSLCEEATAATQNDLTPHALSMARRSFERCLRAIERLPFDEQCGVEQIARAAHVSRRSLEYAFRHHLDCTPREYLLQRRYKQLRRLLLSDPALTSVRAAASSLGINELGRMAGAYRSLFGELPSQTLASRSFTMEPFIQSCAAVKG